MVNARNKGRRGEREVIDEIKELLGIQLEVNYSQTFGGGHDLLGLDGFAIEVKRRKVITPGDLKKLLGTNNHASKEGKTFTMLMV